MSDRRVSFSTNALNVSLEMNNGSLRRSLVATLLITRHLSDLSPQLYSQ